ncbi:MAG: acyltransferase [Proteobacteria bacterium]|nr:acyltransferase [Pseudomonadota bacterium]
MMAVHFGLVSVILRGEFLAVTAVHCFFVLSGFLITRILLQGRRGVDGSSMSSGTVLWRFYARRFLRLFPLYYSTVLIFAIMGVPNLRVHFFYHLAYLTNWRMLLHPMYPVGHFWSLGVEEQFYLLWPLFMLFLPRKAILPFIGLCLGTAVFTRFSLWFGGAPQAWIYIATPANLDFLGLGAFVGWCWEHDRHEWVARLRQLALWVGLPCLLFFLCLAPVWPRFYLAFGGAFSALVMAAVVDQAARGTHPMVQWLAWPKLVWVGKISYGLYILHRFAQFIIRYISMGEIPYPILVVLAVLMTFIMATISWFCLEKPTQALKRFLPYQ